MRAFILVAALLGGASAISTEAKAQFYPWCSTDSRLGSENCGFVTFGQCRAYISGIGGLCYRNPYHAYAAPGRPFGRPYHRKRHYR
jgi:Protein of unknown function (DUF3551)